MWQSAALVVSVRFGYTSLNNNSNRFSYIHSKPTPVNPQTGNMAHLFDDLNIFSLLVACLCHDLDHRGTNNAFQNKLDTLLVGYYLRLASTTLP